MKESRSSGGEIHICDSCGRDTRSAKRICYRCRTPVIGDECRYRRKLKQDSHDHFDYEGRDADEGWAYDDNDIS